MKTALVSALLVLAAGCGGYRGSSDPCRYNPSSCQATLLPFEIEAGSSIQQPPTSYGITTDGLNWPLAWIGDLTHHEFTGSISCPGCTISNVHFGNAQFGDSANQPRPDQVTFNAVTNGNVQQAMLFAANVQPVRFDLYIDGQPAIGSTVFPSMGRLATTDSMPFDLVTNNRAFKVGVEAPREIETAPAPEFKMPEGVQTFTVRAPEPKSEGTDRAGSDR